MEIVPNKALSLSLSLRHQGRGIHFMSQFGPAAPGLFFFAFGDFFCFGKHELGSMNSSPFHFFFVSFRRSSGVRLEAAGLMPGMRCMAEPRPGPRPHRD